MKQITDKGVKYVLDYNNIPTVSLAKVFENNVLEAIHFVVHNRVRLEHREGLDSPWRDDWDNGYGLEKFLYYTISKGFQKEEPARTDSWMLEFWRIKQPDNIDAIKRIVHEF